MVQAESEVRGVAGWLAEPANSSVEQLFTPIASFITALEKEQAEQLLAAARRGAPSVLRGSLRACHRTPASLQRHRQQEIRGRRHKAGRRPDEPISSRSLSRAIVTPRSMTCARRYRGGRGHADRWRLVWRHVTIASTTTIQACRHRRLREALRRRRLRSAVELLENYSAAAPLASRFWRG